MDPAKPVQPEARVSERRWIVRAVVALLLVLGSLPWVISASQSAFNDFYNVPYLWVPADFPPRVKFDAFQDRFDRPEAIVLSWPDCHVDDPRLQALAERLTSDQRLNDQHTYHDLFPDVYTGYGALRDLMREPLSLSRPAALARLEGTLVGPDGSTSCALIMISHAGTAYRASIVEILRDAASDVVGLPRDEFIMAGGLMEGIAIDAESLKSSALVAPSAIISLIFCVICLRSLWLSIPIFGISMLGQGIVLALCVYSGTRMNAVLLVLAPLVFTLTMSAGVHLANYYREEVACHGAAGAVSRALRIGWLPCWLATITTAIGLGSLMTSEVVPVRQFGWLGAVGCALAFTLLYLIFPGAIALWPPKLKTGPASTLHAAESRLLRGFGRFVTHWSWFVSIVSLAAMGWGVVGITRLTTSVDVLSLLPERNRLVRDYAWLESHIGALVPLELIVDFPTQDTSKLIDRLELTARVQSRVDEIPEIGGTLSALNFLPAIPRAGGLRGTVRRRAYNDAVQQELAQLTHAGYLAADQRGQAFRILVRTTTQANQNHDAVMQRLEDEVQQALQQHEATGVKFEGVTTDVTGIMPLVFAGQRMLLTDLTSSFLTAFLIVAAIMMLATRSVVLGLIAMVPNLFPVVIVFGVLGWAQSPVDIGTMMTASVALGIAVDGTLHFLLTFNREMQHRGNVKHAVIETLHHCGRAMWHASAICGLGLLAFCFSGFLPTQRFAIMMFVLLAAALIGDVLLFPALLVGPFRRYFRRHEVAKVA